MNKLNPEEFIARAKEKYGDYFKYDKVQYITYITPVIIICPEHGEFEQTPKRFMRGHHCKQCRKNNLIQVEIDKFNSSSDSTTASFKKYIVAQELVNYLRENPLNLLHKPLR